LRRLATGWRARRCPGLQIEVREDLLKHGPAVIAIDESGYFKPDAGLLPGSRANAYPVPPHDAVPEGRDIATGIARIEQATALRIRCPRSTWAGPRARLLPRRGARRLRHPVGSGLRVAVRGGVVRTGHTPAAPAPARPTGSQACQTP
jgi:hypothetical protein